MSVVLVSRFPADPNNPRGGVETATIGLARALNASDEVDVKIVTVEGSVSAITVEQVDGIEVHRLPQSRFPMLLDIFIGPSRRRLKKYLNELAPDIVHFHESWGLAGWSYGRRYVFTVHGFDSLNLVTSKPFLWRLRSVLWNLGERYGLSRQSRLISIAPYVTEELEQRTRGKISSIWNALHTSFFELPRRRQGQSLVFLGWLNARKNPIQIVEAVGQLKADFPDLRLYLCGEASDPDYLRQLNQKINELDLQSEVILTGRLSQQEVRTRLAEATAMVLPSLQENAPMVIAESMAIGVPVVASNVCGIPDMLDNGQSGILIEPFDVPGTVAALRQLLGDEKQIDELESRGRQAAHDKFHPDSVGAATIAVYRDLLN